MSQPRVLTSTEIVAAATEHFLAGGYRRVDPDVKSNFANARLFEDEFGIVKLVVFETWSELVEKWAEAQGVLVELISKHLSRSDPKAWEGYLVLLTPGIRGRSGKQDWMGIRYNTKRIRKFVASGEDLRSIADVKAAVAALLPLDIEATIHIDASILDLIPDLIAESRGVEPTLTDRIIVAFETQKNMLQELHDARVENV